MFRRRVDLDPWARGSCFLSSMPRFGQHGQAGTTGFCVAVQLGAQRSAIAHAHGRTGTTEYWAGLNGLRGRNEGPKLFVEGHDLQGPAKIHWSGACPRGSRCFSCSPVELTDQDATRQRDAASLLGTRCEERGPGPGKPLPGSIQSQLPVLATLPSDMVTGKSTVRWEEPSSSSCSGRGAGHPVTTR